MKKIDVLSLFGGIECGRVAMERLGWQIGNYYSAEIDEYAMKITSSNYPEIIHIGSVTEVKVTKWLDLLIGGSPCQDLSTAKANGQGLAGEKSGLFFEYVRVLEEARKINPDIYFLLENVASMKKADRDEITRIMGVEPILINSALVSAQNRKRLYWTNIPGVQQPEDREIYLRDILEDIPMTDPSWKPLDEKYIQKDFLERYQRAGDLCMLTEARTEEAKQIRREHQQEHGVDFCPRRGKTLLPRMDEKSNCLTAWITKEHMVVTRKSEAVLASYSKGAYPENMGTYRERSLVLGQFRRTTLRIHADQENSPTLTANMGTGGNNVPIILGMALRNRGEWKAPEFNGSEKANSLTTVQTDSVISDGYYWRKLTPIECERLQTLPDGYTEAVSNSRRYKAIGNGWTVDVIAHILKNCVFDKIDTF